MAPRCLQGEQPLTSLAHGAGAVEGGHAVMAGGPMEAHSRGAVINILTAALTRPAIDTHTAVATQRVEARAPVVASIGLQLTLVHILRAELACGTQTHQSSHLLQAHLRLATQLPSVRGVHLSTQEGTGSCRC